LVPREQGVCRFVVRNRFGCAILPPFAPPPTPWGGGGGGGGGHCHFIFFPKHPRLCRSVTYLRWLAQSLLGYSLSLHVLIWFSFRIPFSPHPPLFFGLLQGLYPNLHRGDTPALLTSFFHSASHHQHRALSLPFIRISLQILFWFSFRILMSPSFSLFRKGWASIKTCLAAKPARERK